MEIGFQHGVFAPTYEEQVNKHGLTYGDKAEWVQKVAYGLSCAYVHGCITDSEYTKILQRFQKNILAKNLKKLEG